MSTSGSIESRDYSAFTDQHVVKFLWRVGEAPLQAKKTTFPRSKDVAILLSLMQNQLESDQTGTLLVHKKGRGTTPGAFVEFALRSTGHDEGQIHAEARVVSESLQNHIKDASPSDFSFVHGFRYVLTWHDAAENGTRTICRHGSGSSILDTAGPDVLAASCSDGMSLTTSGIPSTFISKKEGEYSGGVFVPPSFFLPMASTQLEQVLTQLGSVVGPETKDWLRGPSIE